MFIVLIILLSLLILSLRLVYTGVTVAVRAVNLRNRRLKRSKNNMAVTGIVAGTSLALARSAVRVFIVALEIIRGMLAMLASALLIIDIVVFVIIIFGAAGAYTLYFSEDAGVSSDYVAGTDNSKKESSVSSADLNSITDDAAREYLGKLMDTWGNDVTDERAEVILRGATRIGHSRYSQSYAEGRGGDSDDQEVFDCSSFVGWSFYKCGHEDVSYMSTTASFTGSPALFEQISIDELVPGDVGLMNSSQALYNANHVGIYVGDDNGVKMFMHCSSGSQDSPHPVSTGVRIGSYSSFTVFYRYTGWEED